MFYRDEVVNDYFYWLITNISNGHEDSYIMLLKELFDTAFVYSLERDANRAHDGLDLRDRYSDEMCIDLDLEGPCSVLEMMVALAIRCETDIMYSPELGDRTYIWFWCMIENLGLSDMTDNRFNRARAHAIILRFLDRKYEPDGKGGLFYVPGTNDMQHIEIGYQMNAFLSSITEIN